ncbi:aminoglycoside phosphotransferase family protein [Paracoccaceae bacterium GXU_MW_L88]
MTREGAKTQFLAQAGWGDATRSFLAGDASNRRYDRVTHGARRAVLMDAPPQDNAPLTAFVTMTDTLRGAGLSAPEIYAVDDAKGLMLIEDLGDDSFAVLLREDPEREAEFYAAAVEIIAHVQTLKPPAICPRYDTEIFTREAHRFTDHYPHQGDRDAGTALILESIAATHRTPPVLLLLDFHAENLLWLPEREGLAKVGLLDYQDARVGHPAYDLMSLFEDARRDVTPALRDQLLSDYLAKTGYDPVAFMEDYHALAAQRHLKVLGIFARLTREGRPGYAAHLERVWRLLQEALAAPHLADLKAWVDAHVPPPSEIDWSRA